MHSSENFKHKLVSIRKKSAEKLKQKINSLSKAWHAMLEADSDSVYLREMHAISHGVAGSGATLGFPVLSSLASMLETLLTCVIDYDRRVSDEEYEQLGSFVLALQQSAELIDIQNLTSDSDAINDAVKQRFVVNEKMVYWLGDTDKDTELFEQLGEQGYMVRKFTAWPELDRAVTEYPPELVISAHGLISENESSGLHQFSDKRFLPQAIPILSISDSDTFVERLRFVHQGVTDILVRPVSVAKLQQWLARNRVSADKHPFRVLVVDDDVPLANYYAFLLREAGMLVEVVNRPENTMQSLMRFQPELVLMDVYMPGWNGLEVATVIRQYDEFMSLPIVFLSRESDMQVRLSALERGGDNFITKPVSPAHLVQVVSGRVVRYRQFLNKTLVAADKLKVNSHSMDECIAASIVANSTIRIQQDLEKLMSNLRMYFKPVEGLGHPDPESVLENADSLGMMMQEELNNMMYLFDINGVRDRLEMENFDIGELLVECCRAIRPLAEARSVDITIKDNACIHNCYVKADYGKLTEIILTLLTIALRNTLDSGTIEVDCTPLDEIVRISVRSRKLKPEIAAAEGHSSSDTQFTVLESLLRIMGGEFGRRVNRLEGGSLWIDVPCAYCETAGPAS